MLRCWWGRGGVGHVTLRVKLHWTDATLLMGEGWGEVGHVTLRVKLHWTDATLLMGEGWGGVGHVTLRVRLHWTDATLLMGEIGGGLGWGGACYPSCEVALDGCYTADGGGLGEVGHVTPRVKLHWTDATLLMGEGWGGVGHVTLRVKLHWTDATLLMGEGWGEVGHVNLRVKLHWTDATLLMGEIGGGLGWGGACYPSCEVALDGCYAADGGGLGWGGACYPTCTCGLGGKVSAVWARANSWNTWNSCCRRSDPVRIRRKEASPCIDQVVTSFQKSSKIIVSLRRKCNFGELCIEISHWMRIHMGLEKYPYKRIENKCWLVLNLECEPRPPMCRVPST